MATFRDLGRFAIDTSAKRVHGFIDHTGLLRIMMPAYGQERQFSPYP